MKTTKNQLFVKLAAIFLFSSVSLSLFSQVRIWQFEKRRAIKTQGIYSVLELKQAKGGASLQLLSLGLSYLNTMLTNATGRDENQYSAELESVNEIVLKPDSLVGFVLRSYYVSRKNDLPVSLQTIEFKSSIRGSKLEISINESSQLDYSPVKLERKHKMINSAYVITASALIKEYTDTNGSYIEKVIELGNMNFNQIRVGSNCIYGCNKATGSSAVLLPTKTDKGMKIEVLEISLHFSAKFINPVGTTQSDLNRFLVNHADNNAALIELISTSSLEEESR